MSVSSEATFGSCFNANATDEVIQVKSGSEALRPIIEKHKAQKIFVKMDREGAKFKIMSDLQASGLLEYIHVMIIEWHNRPPDELLKTLKDNGFFYFLERINVEWNVGMIKAVRVGSARSSRGSDSLAENDRARCETAFVDGCEKFNSRN
jgi:hypothetical protein